MNIAVLNGLQEIAENYDGFILDLWGVVHDGLTLFPGVIHALKQLRANSKKLVFLSNAPRRAHVISAQLEDFGIQNKLFDGIVSSGEVTWRYLDTRPDDWAHILGNACLQIGPNRDRSIIEDLNLKIVNSLEEADFILVTGPKDPINSADAYDEILREAQTNKIPMICANPDREVIRGGIRQICAGAIAERYERIGGDVRWHGKPNSTIYQECFRLLEIENHKRILGIGDSFSTDILGANAAGIDALLVADGIHSDDLMDVNNCIDTKNLTKLVDAAGAKLTGVIRELTW